MFDPHRPYQANQPQNGDGYFIASTRVPGVYLASLILARLDDHRGSPCNPTEGPRAIKHRPVNRALLSIPQPPRKTCI
jgi:hypothetical protein